MQIVRRFGLRDLVAVRMHVPECQDDLSRNCDQCEPNQPITIAPKDLHCYNVTAVSRGVVADWPQSLRNAVKSAFGT